MQSEDDGELLDDGRDEYEPQVCRGNRVRPDLTVCFVHRDWSDWRARPVSAVCLFCDHQSETMDLIYAHMKVQQHPPDAARRAGTGSTRPYLILTGLLGPKFCSAPHRFLLFLRIFTDSTCIS